MSQTEGYALPLNGKEAEWEADGWRIQIRDRVRLAVSEEGIRAAVISQESGVSPSALNAFLKGSYEGEDATVARKLETWLRATEARHRHKPRPEFVYTSHSKKIYTALRLVHRQGGIGAIYGDPGIGKTATFLAYRSEFPSTLLLTANPATRSPRPLMLRLLKELNKGTTGSLSSLVWAAEFYLAKSKRLIIVDEAQHLRIESLDLLRYLVDACGVRLVLAGNNTVWDRFHAKGSIPFEQLTSRVAVRLHLDATRITRQDVEGIACQVLKDSPRDCVDWLYERALHQPGHYRFIVNLCRLAQQIAQGKPVTAAHLEMGRKMVE